MRCADADKDPSRGAGRARVTQIVRQRLADVLRNRQVICARPGAPNAELSRRPIEIVERQRDDFPGPQPQPGEQ